MNRTTTVRWALQHPPYDDSNQFIREGRGMAQKEGEAAFESIEILHDAELTKVDVTNTDVQARGSLILERRDAIEARLKELGYDAARHLHEIARGFLDLACAAGLFILNAVLAVFVFLAFGPQWLAFLLALLVL